MVEVQEKVQEAQEKISGGSTNTALKAAAAAAATTAATYAVKKAFSHEHSEPRRRSNGASGRGKRSGSELISAAAATSWEAASEVLLPLADDAAEAAGKYVASHGPEILRERIVPKFIDAFNEAK